LGCVLFDDVSEVQVCERLDSEGSLNLKVMTDFYVDSDGVAEILPQEEHARESDVVGTSRMRRDIVLTQIGSLLGDEVTSDVIVSVIDQENGHIEIGQFHCHSAMLKGKRDVSKNVLFLSEFEWIKSNSILILK